MPRKRSPKRGSRSFSPRKRAINMNGAVNYWPTIDGAPGLIGFAGYKAGMTHLYYVEDKRRSPEYGQEIKTAATIIETPPLLILGIRAYNKTNKGMLAFSEVWMDDIPSYVFRGINSFESDSKDGLENMESHLDDIDEIRVIVATQPSEVPVGKKNPDIRRTR